MTIFARPLHSDAEDSVTATNEAIMDKPSCFVRESFVHDCFINYAWFFDQSTAGGSRVLTTS